MNEEKSDNVEEFQYLDKNDKAIKGVLSDPVKSAKFIEQMRKSPIDRFKDKVFTMCIRFTRNQTLPMLPMIAALYIALATGGVANEAQNDLMTAALVCLFVQFLISVRGASKFFRHHTKVFNQVYRRKRTLHETTHSSTTETGKVIRVGFIASLISSVLMAVLSTIYLINHGIEEGLLSTLSESQFVIVPILIALQALYGINYHNFGKEMIDELEVLVDMQIENEQENQSERIKEE